MAKTPEFTDILYEIKGKAAWITINRPKVYNAFRGQTLE
jgi:2-ketocyclohexanecarboxyl-CoA hydrolase